MCTGTPGTARNRVKDVSRAAENSAFKELSVKFLELNHTNLHNCLKGLPSLHTYENDQDQAVRKSEHVHLARVPRCQRRRRGGARSAPRREIEFSKYVTVGFEHSEGFSSFELYSMRRSRARSSGPGTV